VTKHLIERGIAPIFLGKHELTETYKASASDGVKTKGVIDLREKTSLREAACIMAKARFVLGMDGGLLHLAACSKVPVVFVFTTVHPDFRVPKRQENSKTTVVVPPESLHCRFCNSGNPRTLKAMTYVVGHDFKNCLYKDNLCTKLIDVKTLIPIMDKLLES
jgi:ADP-heptose:LPS heptosyltransferase